MVQSLLLKALLFVTLCRFSVQTGYATGCSSKDVEKKVKTWRTVTWALLLDVSHYKMIVFETDPDFAFDGVS